MKLITEHLREVIAFLSINNLREYLEKAQGVLPPDSQLKSIIVKEIIDKKNLTDKDIKATYTKLKGIIKGYDASKRRPFQITILGPMQAFFSTGHFNTVGFINTIKEQKKNLMESEKELSEPKKTIKDVSTIPFPSVICSNQ